MVRGPSTQEELGYDKYNKRREIYEKTREIPRKAREEYEKYKDKYKYYRNFVRVGEPEKNRSTWFLKFLICIILDIIDFVVGFIGLIPVAGQVVAGVVDGIYMIIGVAMWGSTGLLAGFEALIDFFPALTFVGSFIPILTIVALMKSPFWSDIKDFMKNDFIKFPLSLFGDILVILYGGVLYNIIGMFAALLLYGSWGWLYILKIIPGVSEYLQYVPLLTIFFLIGLIKEGKITWSESKEKGSAEERPVEKRREFVRERIREPGVSREGNPIITFLLLILLIYIGYVGFSLYRTGQLQSLLTGGQIVAEETKIAPGILGVFDSIIHPDKLFNEFYDWTKPKLEENVKPKGVVIEKLFGKRSVFGEEKPIEVMASVRVYGIDKETSVNFECLMDDTEKGEVTIDGIQQKNIIINIDEEKLYGVSCSFNGIKVPEGKKEEGKKVTLKAIYKDFETNSELKVYTLKKEVLEPLEIKGINPFDYYKIKDPLVGNDRMVTSTYDGGPIKLGLGLMTSQPISDGEYSLGISLGDDIGWNGKLDSFKLLYLYFPKDFTQGNCLNDGKTSLTSNELESIRPKQGVDYEKLYCDFTPIVSDKLTYSFIKAKLIYDYVVEKSIVVSVTKLTTSEKTKETTTTTIPSS